MTIQTRKLVNDGVAACGQNIRQIRSIYTWPGAIEDEREARVALHTWVDQTRNTHATCHASSLPIIAGNPSYVQWVLDSTTAWRGTATAE